MKKTPIIIFLLILTLGAGGIYYTKFHRMGPHAEHSHGSAGVYLCPMHPEVVQDKPGQCPICGMDLVLKKQDKKKSDSINRGEILFYRHPMQPSVTSPTMKKDEMGMDYIPVYAEEEGSQGSKVVEGRALTGLSLNQQQLIAIKTDSVKVRPLTKTIYTYGRVAYDPDLYNAQEEYLSALAIEESSSMNPLDQANSRGTKLLEAAHLRLQLLGLSEAQIKNLDETRRVDTRLLLTPIGADKAWVYADIYETDLSLVKPGQKAEVTSSAFPGEVFHGRIVAIDPVLNPKTRTVRARIEVGDLKSRLKPEIFVNVLIKAFLGKALSVPDSTVLDSGVFKLVFVDQGDGNFEPRKVIVGRKAEGYFEIKEGLKEGEKVVSNGNFLLDAESQLRGATAGMTFYKGQEAAE